MRRREEEEEGFSSFLHGRRTKLKKPGTRYMSMYEGGRPTAIKTIAAQV